jgi:hypothetical protein
MLDLWSPSALPYRMSPVRMWMRELRAQIELSTTWPLICAAQPFKVLQVFGIAWIDTDSGAYLEWNVYASTSEPPVRPGSHPFVLSSVDLEFDRPQHSVLPEWMAPERADGPYQTLMRSVPVDLQCKFRADLERAREGRGPSLPIDVVSQGEYDALMSKESHRGS